jgi:hypothetical protein
MGITEYIPYWFAPGDPDVLAQRSFFQTAWMPALGIMVLMSFVTRLDHFGLAYIMFRLTADVEKLPFPMAPVNAMGMTALADASGQRDTWRWRTFAMGGMGGIVFGFIYLAIPNITGAVFSQGLRILPLPFVDLTKYTEDILPGVPVLISFDLTLVVMGMVLPFYAMLGTFIGLLMNMILNVTLYHTGVLVRWEKGIGGIQTIQSNLMDFYFSFSLGLALAVAGIGIWQLIQGFRESRKEGSKTNWSALWTPPGDRGDIPLWVAAGLYIFSTLVYTGTAYYLVNIATPGEEGTVFPLWLLLVYGFIYTPFLSYVSTRMEGIVGQQMPIPFVREATFILSGYKGAAIWFSPIPMHDYAKQSQFFKTTELSGTKFTGLIRAEVLIFPITIAGSILFSQFIWQIGPVPSEMFPYANEFWELKAYQQGLIFSSTLPGEAASPFREAFKPGYVAAGLTLALGAYATLSFYGMPIFLVYGLVRGLDQSAPHAILPMFVGALLGRYIFRRWFGEKRWGQIRIVFAAGFVCGVGLITMFSLGVVFMSKSVVKLPF